MYDLFETDGVVFLEDDYILCLNAVVLRWLSLQDVVNPVTVVILSCVQVGHFHPSTVLDLAVPNKVHPVDLVPLRKHCGSLRQRLLFEQVYNFLQFQVGKLAEKRKSFEKTNLVGDFALLSLFEDVGEVLSVENAESAVYLSHAR